MVGNSNILIRKFSRAMWWINHFVFLVHQRYTQLKYTDDGGKEGVQEVKSSAL